MKMTMPKRLGALGSALALAGVGLFAPATASAQSGGTPARSGTSALIALPFDINGIYTDGGSARPVISDVNDVLTVDMSSQHRPTATGVVINGDTILVTFPDAGTYTAKLVAPGDIRWSNGSTWQRTRLVAVPDLSDTDLTEATTILGSVGLVVGSVRKTVDPTCNNIGLVTGQSPGAGTPVNPGSAVNLAIGIPPHTPCP
jgi:hypothetical protein